MKKDLQDLKDDMAKIKEHIQKKVELCWVRIRRKYFFLHHDSDIRGCGSYHRFLDVQFHGEILNIEILPNN